MMMDYYNRADLSLNAREFLTFCTIAANGACLSQVASHITGNLNVGNSKDMLRAALLVNEEYNGEEKTAEVLRAINESAQEPSEGVVETAPADVIDIEKYTTDPQELAADARSQIQPLSVDIEQYDTIVLGYPIWWGQCPPAVRTFLENYELIDSLFKILAQFVLI